MTPELGQAEHSQDWDHLLRFWAGNDFYSGLNMLNRSCKAELTLPRLRSLQEVFASGLHHLAGLQRCAPHLQKNLTTQRRSADPTQTRGAVTGWANCPSSDCHLSAFASYCFGTSLNCVCLCVCVCSLRTSRQLTVNSEPHLRRKRVPVANRLHRTIMS